MSMEFPIRTVYFDDEGRAKDVIHKLSNVVGCNGYVSIAEYLSICGYSPDNIQNAEYKYGWSNNINTATVKWNDDISRYTIQFPVAERLMLSVDCNQDNMTLNLYQKLAARTINGKLTWQEKSKHALHGMVGEIGEIHSLYQKKYQGHVFDEIHAKKELGDLLWFIAEYCTAHNWNLNDIAKMNIDKLKSRYPDGFDPELSKHRKFGDI